MRSTQGALSPIIPKGGSQWEPEDVHPEKRTVGSPNNHPIEIRKKSSEPTKPP